MLAESDLGANTKHGRFRPRPSKGSSYSDLASRPRGTDSSEEEAEVFIGPATSRLLDREDPPEYTEERTRGVGYMSRHGSVCRYFLSKSGCQRADCSWKHENPEDHERDINNFVAKRTNSSASANGKFDARFNTSHVIEKMEELHIQNKKLARKNQELDSENRDLRSMMKDMNFLQEENLRLRRLLRGHLWDHGNGRGSYYPPRRRSSSHYVLPEDYRSPLSSLRSSRDLSRSAIDY